MTLLRMLAFEPARKDLVSEGGASSRGSGEKPRAARPEDPPQAVSAAGPATASLPEQASELDHSSSTLREDRYEKEWISMVGTLPISGRVRELARNLHLQSRDERQWSFAISPSLRHLGSKQCVDSLGRAISKTVGQAINVSLTDGPETDLLTEAAITEKGQRRKQSDADRAIEDDPTVRALKDRLGASIVEDSIQPLQ